MIQTWDHKHRESGMIQTSSRPPVTSISQSDGMRMMAKLRLGSDCTQGGDRSSLSSYI